MKTEITPHDVLAIAHAAFTTPRTVKRWLDGHSVRPNTEVRIKNALTQLGRGDVKPKRRAA